MPLIQSIIGLPGFQVDSFVQSEDAIVQGSFRLERKCKHCGFEGCRIKDRYLRRLKHARQDAKIVWVEVRGVKMFCSRCQRSARASTPGVLPRLQSTESFRKDVFERHETGTSQRALSQSHRIAPATVERWYKEFISYRLRETKTRRLPRVLGIDEHFFTRKQGFATTLVDLHGRFVFDVTLGRSEAALAPYFRRLSDKGRVRLVLMDLSETYRQTVKREFPNAMIVADRFHVVRVINHHFLKVWQEIDPMGRKNRGLLSLMRRHPWRMEPQQMDHLMRYLCRHPLLKAVYEFREKLLKIILFRAFSKREIRPVLHEFLEAIEMLLDSPIEHLKTLGQTLQNWREEIARMWRIKYTNSTTEGFHNRMEVISRRAYGFRNFENYRMRVIALCGWSGVLARRT